MDIWKIEIKTPNMLYVNYIYSRTWDVFNSFVVETHKTRLLQQTRTPASHQEIPWGLYY